MSQTIAGTRTWADAAPETSEAALAAETLDLFFAVMSGLKSHLEASVAEYDLNPMQMFALRCLHDPMPMGQLAETLGCDPSHVTGVADDLEARGALERQPHPSDRRIKLLALTEDGQRLRDEVEARLFEGMPLTNGLTERQQHQLRDLLSRVVVANAATAADDDDG